jgi:regulator of replication initiation timing
VYYSKKKELVRENDQLIHENEALKQRVEEGERRVNNIVLAHKKSSKVTEESSGFVQKKRRYTTPENEGKAEVEGMGELNAKLT